MNLMINYVRFLPNCLYMWLRGVYEVCSEQGIWLVQPILKMSKSKLMLWILKSSCGMTKLRKKIQTLIGNVVQTQPKDGKGTTGEGQCTCLH